LVHGVPGNFFLGFRPDSPEPWVEEQLAGTEERVVAGGHTHFPMVRSIRSTSSVQSEGWLVLNSGSVGIPYDGDPRTAYVWMEGEADGWHAEIRRLDYDRERVALAYQESGLAEAGGPMGEMVLRSVLTGLPWVSDFGYWMREQGNDGPADVSEAQRLYDTQHGPGRWAFPFTL
jgi:hypothetical protein